MQQSSTKVIDFVIEKAKHLPGIQRLVLFGSRARGDARPTSDYDFAIHATGLSHADWSKFSLEIDETVPTLCGVDLILVNDDISNTLRDEIEREGRTLYESH